eukprot:g1875.t1
MDNVTATFEVSDAECLAELRALTEEMENEERDRGSDRSVVLPPPPSYEDAIISPKISLQEEVKKKTAALLQAKMRAKAWKDRNNMDMCRKVLLKQVKPLKKQLETLEQRLREEVVRGGDSRSESTYSSGHVDHARMMNIMDESEGDGENIAVTDADMNDPEMLAQLRAMGYESDGAGDGDSGDGGAHPPADRVATAKARLISEIENKERQFLVVKKRALALKKAGNMVECRRVMLSKGKPLKTALDALKAKLEACESSSSSSSSSASASPKRAAAAVIGVVNANDDVELKEEDITAEDMNDPEMLAQLRAMGYESDGDGGDGGGDGGAHPPADRVATAKARLISEIENKERQFLVVKKRALALKKAGNMVECRRVMLSKGKPLKTALDALKAKLEACESSSSSSSASASPKRAAAAVIGVANANDDVELKEEDITAEDMNDPEMLAQLRAMGYESDGEGDGDDGGGEDDKHDMRSSKESTPHVQTKSVLERERLESELARKKAQFVAVKQKAIELKRQGKIEECRKMVQNQVKPLKLAMDGLRMQLDTMNETVAVTTKKTKEETVLDRLRVYYTYWEPGRLKRDGDSFLLKTLKRYEGKESQLLSDLKRKYGPEPSTIAAQLKSREMEYIKIAMERRKKGDATATAWLQGADKLKAAREKVAAGVQIDTKALPVPAKLRLQKEASEENDKRKKTLELLMRRVTKEIKAAGANAKNPEVSKMMKNLKRLRSLQQNGSLPLPSYRIVNETRRVPVVQIDVAESDLEVVVIAGVDLEKKKSFSAYVTFDMDFPRDGVCTGKTKVVSSKRERVEWNCKKCFSEVLAYKNDRGMARRDRRINRAKAEFTVWQEGGFFASDSKICRAVVPLKSLLTKSKVLIRSPALDVDSRKRVGGHIEVMIRVKEALSGGEMREEIRKRLAIDWTSVPAPTDASASSSSTPMKASVTSSATPSSLSAPALSAPSTLDPAWIKDPHNVKFIISYECLKMELAFVANALAKQKGGDLDAAMFLQTRQMVILAKIAVIERDYAAGHLTPDEYFPALRSAMTRDRNLAVYFRGKGKRNDAVRCLRRVKTMKQEISDLKKQFGG